MYINDALFVVFFLFAIVILFVGFVLFLGVPGAMLFSIFDTLPSVFLDRLHGDNILPIGMKYSFTWPFVVIGAFALSKVKFGNYNRGRPVFKFSFIWFFTFLFLGSSLLAGIYHQEALPTPEPEIELKCELFINNSSSSRNCINDNYFKIIKRHYRYHLKKNPSDTGDIKITLTTDAIGSIVSTNVTTDIKSIDLVERIHKSETSTSFTERETREKTLVYHISYVEKRI